MKQIIIVVHRQKFRIDMRSEGRHLENINAIFITEKWLREDRKSKKIALEALEVAYFASISLVFF